MRVRIGAEAKSDLKAIARWIGHDNPTRALSFTDELQAKCAALAHSPKQYAIVGTTQGADIRKLVHDRYIILYTVSDHVEVLRIIHSARDWWTLFDQLK